MIAAEATSKCPKPHVDLSDDNRSFRTWEPSIHITLPSATRSVVPSFACLLGSSVCGSRSQIRSPPTDPARTIERIIRVTDKQTYPTARDFLYRCFPTKYQHPNNYCKDSIHNTFIILNLPVQDFHLSLNLVLLPNPRLNQDSHFEFTLIMTSLLPIINIFLPRSS